MTGLRGGQGRFRALCIRNPVAHFCRSGHNRSNGSAAPMVAPSPGTGPVRAEGRGMAAGASSGSGGSASAEGPPAPAQTHLIQPPSISLPKGGGAIRGLGEKFTAN
ncbi:MAG: hypothetical protein ACK56I_20365, partial [bacterium]